MQKSLKSNESQKIFVLESFRIEIQKEGSDIFDSLQSWFSPETRSLVFNL